VNILFSLTAYPPAIGGAQLLVHQLARELGVHHRIQVITLWDTNRTDWLLGTTINAPRQVRVYQMDGVPVRCITLSDETRRRLTPWVWAYYVVQGPALRRIADALAAEMAPWAAQAELVHNCRIGREGLSYASFKLARERDVPFVLTPVHHPRWESWLHRYYHRLYRQADAVIALTEAERQTLINLGVDEHRVFVTGMGPILAETHDGARFRAQHNLGDAPLVLFLAQKYAYKGVAALLRATQLVWQRLPEVRFAFVGPRTAYSRRLFASVCDARILELDTVSLQEKTDALAACDVLCVPSSQESFGGVFTEAWSFGKPVIGCNIPAVAEVIADGVDGYLVSQEPAQIAERICHLLLHPTQAQTVGAAGQRKVKAHYTWQQIAERTEQAYRRAGSLGSG
jgi:glycosyltransferase involved in cell wall biosynthesis